MPEANGGVAGDIDRAIVGADEMVLVVNKRRVVKLPDQPAGYAGQQRVIEVTLPPHIERPGAVVKQEALDARGLRRKDALEVLHDSLELLEGVGVMVLDVGGAGGRQLLSLSPRR